MCWTGDYLCLIFVVDVSNVFGSDRPNQDIISLEDLRHLPCARQVLPGSRFEPANCFSTSQLIWRERQILIKPFFYFSQRISLIIRQVAFAVDFCQRTKESRPN